MNVTNMQHIPLASSYLCPDCNCIGNCSEQCPACASPVLLALANVLDRKAEGDSAVPYSYSYKPARRRAFLLTARSRAVATRIPEPTPITTHVMTHASGTRRPRRGTQARMLALMLRGRSTSVALKRGCRLSSLTPSGVGGLGQAIWASTAPALLPLQSEFLPASILPKSTMMRAGSLCVNSVRHR